MHVSRKKGPFPQRFPPASPSSPEHCVHASTPPPRTPHKSPVSLRCLVCHRSALCTAPTHRSREYGSEEWCHARDNCPPDRSASLYETKGRRYLRCQSPLDDWLADLESFRPRMRISQSMCVPRTNAVNSSLVRECSAAEADAGKGLRGVLGRLSLRRIRLLSSPMDGTLIRRRSNWMRTGN
jgi:hypothetical protein